MMGFDERNWFNAEDNSDLDTSNESYMSSSDEEEDDLPIFGGMTPKPKTVKELTREDKAILQRRFEPYF